MSAAPSASGAPLSRPLREDPLARMEAFLIGDGGWGLALVALTLLAAGLRVLALRRVALDPFYDAAVRSMGLSWHNFFFGAFDPSAGAAVDKPPVDLWLQVVSVKLLGYEPLALKLPAAAASTLAVPLLYDLVRRLAGRAAGLTAALALAVMPVSVLTARSDTMDSLMMALLVLCAWLVVRAGARRSARSLLLAGAVLGLAFNTKLLEALVAAPALALLAALVCDWGTRGARLRRIALGGATFLVVALSWITVVSLVPLRERPYPMGASNGSVWNMVFVYNGIDRITQPPRPDTFGTPPATVLLASTKPPSAPAGSIPASIAATAPAGGSATRPVARRHRPPRVRPSKSPAGPLRLFTYGVLDYGGLLGELLAAAIAFGALALVATRPSLFEPALPGREGRRQVSPAGAGVLSVALWLATGYVLFSFSGRLHQRYLESFTPAVAIALGAGLAALGARARERRALWALLGALAVSVIEVVVVTGTGTILHSGEYAALALGLAVIAAGAVALAYRARRARWPWWWLPGLVTAGVVSAVLVYPLARDVRLIRDHSSDEAASPLFKPRVTTALSRFLRAHQGSARYEFAAAAPTIAAPVLTRDVRPILLLTTFDARTLVGLPALQRSIAAGQVRYVLTRGSCPHPRNRRLSACSPTIAWVKAHGLDVTARLHAGTSTGLLYAFGAGIA